MIGSLIEAQFVPPQHFYGLRGRGRDQLIVKLLDILRGGFTEVIRCDIVNCFDSMNPEALTMLPLTEGVIKNTLYPPSLQLVMKAEKGNASENCLDRYFSAPSGLPGVNDSAVGR